jgi:NADH-quinone oxidoreductase subunit N
VIDQLFGFLSYYIPEVICVVLMTTLLLAESAVKNDQAPRVKIHLYTQLGLFIALISLFQNLGEKPVHIFHNAVTIDPFSTLVKIIMVIGTMGCVYIRWYAFSICQQYAYSIFRN